MISDEGTNRIATDGQDEGDVEVSVVIISWNTREILRDCLAELPAGLSGISHEVLVVDNGSSDGTQEMLNNQFPNVILLDNEVNLGFPSAVNRGIEHSRGAFIAILNSDTMVTKGSIRALVDELKRDEAAAAVGPQLVGKDGHFQYSGGFAPSLLAAFNELPVVSLILGSKAKKLFIRSRTPGEAIQVDWLCAACMVVRREAIASAGMFDDDHFMYAEDMEYGLRLRAHGWKVLLVPRVKVVHYGGASSVGLPETKLLWLGGLFRVAAGRLSRISYLLFGVLLSIAYLQRSVLIWTVRIMPGLNKKGLAHAREAATYSRTAFLLGFHDPQYASEFCRKLEERFRSSQRSRPS
ncbi:MAG: glycosyltransferase family 2 protein [Thermoleophilia bacterium]